MKHTFLGIKILVFSAVVCAGLLVLLITLPLNTPLKAFIVLSGSMDPVAPAGSMVLVQRQTQLFSKGDMITFIHPTNPTEYITHRVIGIQKEGNSLSYQTKGDANSSPDIWLVKREAVWGKVNLVVPYLGYLVNFAKTTLGLILFIILPLLFIAISEILVIIKEVKQFYRSKRKLYRFKLNS